MGTGAGRILVGSESLGKEHLQEQLACQRTGSVYWRGGNTGYSDFGSVNRGYWGEYTALARAMVLGIPHFCEEIFQVLLDMTS